MLIKNGDIATLPGPLISFGPPGATDQYGPYEWLLSTGTLAKVRALQALAYKRTGRMLTPSAGYSCFRPLAFQVLYRKALGNGAATPGTSSHGGTFEGSVTLAVDLHNWEAVYSGFGGRDQFYADCRAVGLTPGKIDPSRGYPYEPWHVIDYDPWRAVPAGQGSTPFEEDDMTPIEMLTAKFQVPTSDGSFVERSVADALTATYVYGDLLNKLVSALPADVWQYPLTHPLAKDSAGNPAQIAAGDYLRYEPAEHANTRAAVAQVATSDIDLDKLSSEIAAKYPQLDVHALAIAAADEADKRERERLGS